MNVSRQYEFCLFIIILIIKVWVGPLLFMPVPTQADGVSMSLFTKTQICDVHTILENDGAYLETGAKDLLHCVVFCSMTQACVGSHWTLEEGCYLHRDCPEVEPCDMGMTETGYLLDVSTSASCRNAGVWNTDRNRCDCKNAWIGPTCEDKASICHDLLVDGYETGIYFAKFNIYNDVSDMAYLTCLVNQNLGWVITEVFGNFGTTDFDFNKTLGDYENGFMASFDFSWIGLNSLRRLNELGHTKVTIKASFRGDNTINLFREYTDFQIDGKLQRYQFTFGSTKAYSTGATTSMQLGDCLSPLQSTPFSVWDAEDSQSLAQNCSLARGSGWWGSGCNDDCNPLGIVPADGLNIPQYQQLVLPGIDLNAQAIEFVVVEMTIERP